MRALCDGNLDKNSRMDDIIFSFKQHVDKIVQQLQEDLKTLRSGRAAPAFIESLQIKTYGGQTTLKLLELATITTDGPTTLAISPFDQSTVADIEKAILSSPLGLNPQTQGTTIRVKIPPLSEEQREKIIKTIGQKIEEKKVHIRNLRDDQRKKIKSSLEKKEIAEDMKFRLEKEIDIVTQKIMEFIQEIKEKKEEEIMQV